MLRGRGLVPLQLEAGSVQELGEKIRRTQTEQLRQIRQEQVPLSARRQVTGKAFEKGAQKPMVGVEDRAIEPILGRLGKPGRIAHHQIGPSLREEIALHHLETIREVQPGGVFTGAGDRPGIDVRGQHARDAPL